MAPQSPEHRWVPATLLAGGVYLVAGLALGELAGRATSVETRELWRRAAWLISAIAFGAHIAYEHFRLRNQTRQSALHASLAAALAAFGLAAAANLHDQPESQRVLMLTTLVSWPVLVAIPAFVVAFIGATLLRRVTSRR
jgi:hypothetical protein